ncbi:MAG: alpha-ketoglutarate-dependent dioxygenase AlkB [Pseudomonadota bacterium]
MIEQRGFRIYKEYLSRQAQVSIVEEIRHVAKAAPLFSPETRGGRKMSVRMTSAGRYGWFSDRSGYRYIPNHPSGAPWPPIPASILEIWSALCSTDRRPDCCLINYYGEAAKMGLHQDSDEADFRWPVLSVSLGDPARFRMGGPERSDPTQSIILESGDVVVMGGEARLAYHGIDRIMFGGSKLLPQGGRINLTLRVVD